MDDKGFFREIIDIYIQRFDIKENTKRSYGKMLAQFAEFADGLPNLPTRQDVMAYREQLKSRLRAASVQKHIVVIRGFYRWYYIEGFGPNAAEGVKGMKIESDFKRESLSLEAAIKLLNRAKRYASKSIIGKRDHALIALLLTTGLRTIEVERADVDDISFVDETKVLYIMGKGHDEKDAYVKLSPEVYSLIEEYLIERQDGYKPLFINHTKPYQGTRLRTRMISMVVKEMLRDIGIDDPKYSAHSLRHTAASLALDLGGDLDAAQQLMRHKDISTTKIYAHRLSKAKNHLEWQISTALFQTTKKKK
ncbi:MAG: hypothetical protein A2Z84_04090 [Tenericutes bacterium GWA2_35_7]|nr:MAG: hypothetical protein A2Z84_04090 [Tenericutes bacterium GWA2_35_7]